MRKIVLLWLCLGVFILVCLSVSARNVDLWCVNDGTVCVPGAASFAAGHCPITLTIGTHGVSVSVESICPGGGNVAWNDFGSDSSGSPTVSSPVTNIIIDNVSSMVDGNGNPEIEALFHWYVPPAPPPVECTTNVQVSLYDSYTNQIFVSIYFPGGRLATTATMQGPLNGNVISLGVLDCTNAPASATYSNIPPCMQPVVFNVVNTASAWRIFGVQDVTSPTAGTQLLGQSLVGPGAGYYWSNTVSCASAGNFHLYASGGNGDDSVTDTGLTGQGYSNPATTNGVDGIASSGSGAGQGTTGNGAGNSPPVNNTPPPVLQPTNSTLAVTPPVTNNIVWASTNQDITQMTPALQNGQQAIYNAANTAAQQAHSDASGMNSTAQSAAQQAHSDAASAQSQSVSNVNGVIGSVNNMSSNNVAAQQQTAGAIGGAAGVASAQASQQLGATQNGTAAVTNALNSAASNIVSSLTNFLAGQPGINGTNGLSPQMTNYALETTQDKVLATMQGVSNVIAGPYSLATNGGDDGGMSNAFNAVVVDFVTNGGSLAGTNFSVAIGVSTNSAQMVADASAGSGSASTELGGVESGLAAYIGAMSPVDVDDSWAAPNMVISFGGNLPTMDCNPMHNDGVAALFMSAKTLFAWVIAVLYMIKCADDAGRAIDWVENARGVQVTSPTTKKTYS